jgi:dCMP deaminase
LKKKEAPKLDRDLLKDQVFLNIAKELMRMGTCTHLKVGAVLVKDGRIISTGWNGNPKGMPHCDDIGCTVDKTGHCISTLHAELNAVVWAARAGVPIDGSVLYTTDYPCYQCTKIILASGIKRVCYLRDYGTKESVERIIGLFAKAGIVLDQYVKRGTFEGLDSIVSFDWIEVPEGKVVGEVYIRGRQVDSSGRL